MSAERGWIADPPPRREHHTPGWLSEKGTAEATSTPLSTLKFLKGGRRWPR
jgi:hypothetical protein